MALHQIIGDATRPSTPVPWVIAHVCNDIGKWGRGFVLPLGKRWPAAKRAFLDAAASEHGLVLGETGFVEIGESQWVANMIGQRGIMRKGRKDIPLRPAALASCLARVNDFALEHGASVHMPRIGAGLSGGSWGEIEALIRAHMDLPALEVHVYDLPSP